MSKTIQHELPGFGQGQNLHRGASKSTQTRFYYLRNRRRDKMISIDSDTGQFIEIEHDTLNDVPHLWNSRNQAKFIARKYFGYTVELYPYEPR